MRALATLPLSASAAPELERTADQRQVWGVAAVLGPECVPVLTTSSTSVCQRLDPLIEDWVQVPATMPGGNRSILFRDPDQDLVNLFTPVAEEALAWFSGRP